MLFVEALSVCASIKHISPAHYESLVSPTHYKSLTIQCFKPIDVLNLHDNKLFLCHMNQLKTTISTMKLMVSRCQYIIMIN